MKGPRAPIRYAPCIDCGRETPEARLIDGVCVPCRTPDRWPPPVESQRWWWDWRAA